MVTQQQIATLKDKVQDHLRDVQEVFNAIQQISDQTITNPNPPPPTINVSPRSTFDFADMTQAQIDAHHAAIITRITEIKAAL